MILCSERSTIKQVISCVKVPYILRILKNFFLHCFPWVRIIWKGRLRYRAWVKKNVLNQEQERNVQFQLWVHSIGNYNGLFAIEKCDNLCKNFLWNLTFLTLINWGTYQRTFMDRFPYFQNGQLYESSEQDQLRNAQTEEN